MKKTILLSSILAVGAAFAESASVESANAIGALDVTISTTRAQTLVSVPFLGYEDGGAVAVKDMVKTSDLADGSKLYVPNGKGAYNTFKLQSGAWVADERVNIGPDGQTSEDKSEDQGSATVNRGDAFWIEPKNATDGKIYLLGQGVTDAGSSTVSANAWNLVGNTSAEQKTISGEGYKKGEKICVQLADETLDSYTFKVGTGWVKIGDREASPVIIQPGQGFWFLSKGTTSIAW